METQTRNMLFKITFLKKRRNESLSLVSNQKDAIWVYLRRKREVERCFKTSCQGESGTSKGTWLLTRVPPANAWLFPLWKQHGQGAGAKKASKVDKPA